MTKISIVTPSYNLDRYISETIESVLSQEGNFDLEYIIIDGGSTDQSIEIIKKYETLVREKKWPIKCHSIDFKWRSEKDNGMYDAINKGFSLATGDIFAWLNADDRYEKGALASVTQIFEKFPEISWLKGTVTSVEADGEFIKKIPLRIYHQDWLTKGIYGESAYFLEQDTVFWRANLWKNHSPIPTEYKYCGDYWLWLEFAKEAKLWSVNVPISIFRKRSDQLSQNMSATKAEIRKIQPRGNAFAHFAIRAFLNIYNRNWAPKNLLENIYNKFFRKNSEFFLEKEGENFVKKGARSFIAF